MRTLPNLAARPFVNDRPVRRLIGLLWGLAVLLLLFNAFRYWRYATTNVEGRQQLQAIRDETNREFETIEALRTELAGFDLRSQNDEIDFLNRRIAERSFPWSELFAQLGEVLPRGVRVRSLAPQLPEPQRTRRRRSAEETRVTLRIDGSAENGEALLDFVDRLFAHPAFAQPLLERETRQSGTNLINFNLETYYRPRLEVDDDAETAVADAATDASAGVVAAGASRSAAPGTDGSTETAGVRPGGSVPTVEPSQSRVGSGARGVGESTAGDSRSASGPSDRTVPGATGPGHSGSRRPSAVRPGAGGVGPGSRTQPTPRRGTATPERSRANASSPPGAGGGR